MSFYIKMLNIDQKSIDESQNSDLLQLILDNPTVSDVYKNMAKYDIDGLIEFIAQQAQGLNSDGTPNKDRDNLEPVELIFGKQIVDKCIKLNSGKLDEIKQITPEIQQRIDKVLKWAEKYNEKNPGTFNVQGIKFQMLSKLEMLETWEEIMKGLIDNSGSMGEIQQLQGGGDNLTGFLIKDIKGFKYPEFKIKPSEIKHNSKFIRKAVFKLRDLNKDQLSGRMHDNTKFWNNRIAQMKRLLNDEVLSGMSWFDIFDILITHIIVEGGYYLRAAIKNAAQNRDQNLDEAEDKNNDKRKLLKDFLKYCIEDLELQKPLPKIHLTSDKSKTETYGHFDPNGNTIVVYTKNRGLGDIMRTIAHELIHRRQDQDNRIEADSGETGSPIENEANAYAGVLLRNFGKQNKEIFTEHLQKEIRNVGEKINAKQINDNFIKVDINGMIGALTSKEIVFVFSSNNIYAAKGVGNKIKYFEPFKKWLDQRHVKYEDKYFEHAILPSGIISVPYLYFNIKYENIDEIKQLPGEQLQINRKEFYKLLNEIKTTFSGRLKDLRIPEKHRSSEPSYFQYGSLYVDHLSFGFFLENPTDEDKKAIQSILDDWMSLHQMPQKYPNNKLWGDCYVHPHISYGTEPPRGTGFSEYETNVRCSINRQFISNSGGHLEELTQKLTEAILKPFGEIKQVKKAKAIQNGEKYEIEGLEWNFHLNSDATKLGTYSTGSGESGEEIKQFLDSKGIPYTYQNGDDWFVLTIDPKYLDIIKSTNEIQQIKYKIPFKRDDKEPALMHGRIKGWGQAEFFEKDNEPEIYFCLIHSSEKQDVEKYFQKMSINYKEIPANSVTIFEINKRYFEEHNNYDFLDK
jgi:hypothetical protein